MKKNTKGIIGAFFLVSLLMASGVTYASENITDYSVDITVNPDSTVRIKETIDYDFESQSRHGILRNIPFKYSARGGSFKLRYSDFSVNDKDGNNYKFTRATSGNNVSLKIGDPNAAITGKNTYVISYTVRRVINYFNDFDELYWNAIGTEWGVPIQKAQVTVYGPAGVDFLKANQFKCYIGALGSQKLCMDLSMSSDKLVFNAGSGNDVALKPGEGMTVAVAFAKRLVHEPTRTEKILAIIKDNWIAGLPFLILAVMSYLWWTRGRDPKGRGTIVAEFESPDNLTPTEVGIILDERADNKDISAAIVYLAVRGYLKIKRLEEKILIFKKTDYELEKVKNGSDLKSFEQELLSGLFEKRSTVKLSELKNKFYKKIEKINKDAYELLVQERYFPKNPNKVRSIYQIVAGVLIGAGFIGFGGEISFMSVIASMSLAISGFLVMAFSFIMPVKTQKGVMAREKILGLKTYITVAEKDRINFHNAPKKNPEHFEKLLPFAMVLGVEKEWAVQFEGIYTQNPDWYSGSTGMHFSATAFASELGGFSTAALASAASGSSGSGGGGFSGGGGGGGGGGSW